MSKIGCQSQSGTIPDFTKIISKKPIAWKLLGNAVNLGVAQTIRQLSPDTLIILRADSANWSLDAGVVDYAERAMRVAEPFLRAGLCDLLESPNEPIIWNDSDAKRLNEQMVQLATIYQRNGFQPLAYQFSVGNPAYELWQYLDGGILASDGWVGLHEYGAPTLEANSADLSLRHRKVFPLLSPAARGMLKVVISECGLDFGIGRPPDNMPKSGGYRAMPAQGDSEEYWIRSYTTQLEWWDAELAKDAYVIASTVFGYAMNEPWVGLGFDVANVDTDRAYYINWQRSGKAVIPPPIGDKMQVYEPYTFPKQLSDVAWQGVEGKPTPDQPFYRIQPSAGLLVGVSAFVRLTITDPHGIPLAGVKVINAFGDGHGEVQQSDSTGTVQFNFGPSSAFTPPTPPPLTFFVADDSAYRDDDKFIHYKYQLSDIIKGGDTNGNHTEGSAVLVAQVVMPDATDRESAIRLRAYPAKALSIPVYCAACALQAQGRKRTMGAVISDEFYVTWAGVQYVAQAFATAILATQVGHYADSDFFEVAW